MPQNAKSDKITKEKIIHAVLESASTRSVGAISLADIVEKLGIKKASLYNHYDGRDAIISDATRFCGDYLMHLSVVPSGLAAVAEKESAETVLKGIVNRWFKENEKEPLFQIYSFVESEKYFSSEAAKIVLAFRAKLSMQIQSVLSALVEAGKLRDIKPAELKDYALIFTSMLRELVDMHIVRHKDEIRTNPETGEDSLFGSLPFEDAHLLDANRLVGRFINLLNAPC